MCTNFVTIPQIIFYTWKLKEFKQKEFKEWDLISTY